MNPKKPTTVEEYVAAFSGEVRERLETLRKLVKEQVPQAEERISYDMPAYFLNGQLVYFAAWKKHIAFYPISSVMVAAIPELKNYNTSGKGTVQFQHNESLPLELIHKIIDFRVLEKGEK